MTVLREYQTEAVRMIAGSKKDPGYLADSPVAGLIMPTGSGKSVTVAAIVRQLVEAGRIKGAVVAAPQTHIVEAFQAEAPDLWRPASDGKDLARYIGQGEQKGPFGILCAHALLTPSVPVRLPKNLAGRLLVLDEGHHAGASVTAVAGEAKGKDAEHVNKLSALRDRWVKRGGSVLIVTATPWRNDRADVLGGAPVYHRTLAEHMADPAGYCPPRLSVEHVVIQESVAAFKDARPKVVAKAADLMAAQWVKDGRPKTVCIVPGRKTEVWIGALKKAFAKHEARTLVTIGTTGQAATLRRVLDHERTVTRFADSQVDVMIACKRFDEGTDWPICSHVYVAGLPRQMNTTVQRVGRALRSKKGIKGHPHGKAATITFFAPRWNQDTDVVRKRHRDEAMMLACFMADHETGARFLADPLGDPLRSRAKGKHRGTIERLIHRLKASDSERTEAAAEIQRARARLGDKPAAKDLMEALRKTSDSERWDDRKDVLVTMLVAAEEQRRGNKAFGVDMERRLVERAKEAFGLVSSGKGKPRPKGIDSDIIRAEVRAIWDAAVEQQGTKTVARVDASVLALVSGYTGLDAKGFAESLSESRTRESCEAETRAFAKEKKRSPIALDLPNVVAWVRYNLGMGWSEWLQECGLEQTRNMSRTREQCEGEMKAFSTEHGRAPTIKDMKDVADWIRVNLGLRWSEWLQECGLEQTRNMSRTRKSSEAETIAFMKNHGRSPTVNDLPNVAAWVGRNIGSGWSEWLRTCGLTSACNRSRTRESCETETVAFMKNNGRAPKLSDMRGVYRWVTYNIGIGWLDWLRSCGLGPVRDVEQTREACKEETMAFFRQHGRFPKCVEMKKVRELVRYNLGLGWSEWLRECGLDTENKAA